MWSLEEDEVGHYWGDEPPMEAQSKRMKNEFASAISQLASEKGVSTEVVIEAIQAALVSAYRRNFNSAGQNIVAEIDRDTGTARVYVERTVVEEPTDDPSRISLEEARKIDPAAQVGGVVRIDVTPQHFGRIAAQTAKQVVFQKLRDAERRMVLEEFAERKDEIAHGIVQRIEAGNAVVELGRAEAILPRSEQIPTERYYPGQRIRVYVSEVHDTHRGPQIILSRGHRMMLRRLLEQEVPEIFNGTVEIKAIAREAGYRSKVAVVARQEGVDPVGSCVGMRGVRIQNIVNELSGEKIDVIEWSDDPAKFVANALSPAQVLSVEINEEEKTATVIVPEKQLSLAIGREGQNARLAAKLTGWRIDIKSDTAVAESARASGASASREGALEVAVAGQEESTGDRGQRGEA